MSLGVSLESSIENSLRNLGVMTLWWQPYGSVILVSNGSTVSNPEQMKDKKVRVFGETLGNVVLASGGKPTAIPNSPSGNYWVGGMDLIAGGTGTYFRRSPWLLACSVLTKSSM